MTNNLKKTNNMNIMDCFNTDNTFGFQKYFVFLNNRPPHCVHLSIKVDANILKNKIIEHYKIKKSDLSIGNFHEYEDDKLEPKKIILFILCLIKEGFLFSYSYDNDSVSLFYSDKINQTEIDELIKLTEECKKPPTIDHLFYMVIVNELNSLELKEFKVKPSEIDIYKNYNDDFEPINNKVINFINNDNQNGIVLLHGKFGSGKTTYLRHIITKTKKKVIYLPVNLFEKICDPSFLAFLAGHAGSIFIIEDCENIVVSRENNPYSGSISNLLNLGDGLLSDALNIKVICTFNTELTNIDKALLRKGRLVTRYEFNELSIEKTMVLLAEFAPNYTVTSPLTLAEIYNILDENNVNISERKKIGF